MVAAALAATPPGAGAATGDWPEFRFAPTHTGFNPAETIIGPANVGSLTTRWTGITGGVVPSSPAVANGVVYVGSVDHKLYAFDAAGSAGCSWSPKACVPLWTATTRNTVASGPAVANGVVYVGSQDHKLYAFGTPPCTLTLTGTVSGPLTINAGQSVCLTNAQVAGPVTVNPGGALRVAASSLAAGVVANAPAFFGICSSKVAAPPAAPSQGVVVTNASVTLRLGDPDNGCALNQVSGGVSLTGDTGGLTLGGNHLTGDVTVSNDTVGTAVVKANQITGVLACSGDNPPPTNAGQPNAVSGGETGQCVGL
jgi:outer membrane protein assembly factor BamB